MYNLRTAKVTRDQYSGRDDAFSRADQIRMVYGHVLKEHAFVVLFNVTGLLDQPGWIPLK